MKHSLVFSFLIAQLTVEAQTKFRVVEHETDTWRSIYSLVDENNHTIKVLDSAQYFMRWSGVEYGYFAVMGKKRSKGKGWPAIDAYGNILFYVYNAFLGEPGPDYLIENKIRII